MLILHFKRHVAFFIFLLFFFLGVLTVNLLARERVSGLHSLSLVLCSSQRVKETQPNRRVHKNNYECTMDQEL